MLHEGLRIRGEQRAAGSRQHARIARLGGRHRDIVERLTRLDRDRLRCIRRGIGRRGLRERHGRSGHQREHRARDRTKRERSRRQRGACSGKRGNTGKNRSVIGTFAAAARGPGSRWKEDRILDVAGAQGATRARRRLRRNRVVYFTRRPFRRICGAGRGSGPDATAARRAQKRNGVRRPGGTPGTANAVAAVLVGRGTLRLTCRAGCAACGAAARPRPTAAGRRP